MKNFADSRVRVKGRFVKKEDQIALIAQGVHPIIRIRDRNGSNSDFSCDGGDKLKDRDSSTAGNTDGRGLCVDELDLDDDDDNDNDDIDNNGDRDRDRDTDRESQDEILSGGMSVKQSADIGGSSSNSSQQTILPQGHGPQGNGTEIVGLGRTRRSTQSNSLIQRDR